MKKKSLSRVKAQMPPCHSFVRLVFVTAPLVLTLARVISAKSSRPRTTPSLRASSKILNATNTNSFTHSDSDSNEPYFPESSIVLDMANLSNAVYHLRNKVLSCHDANYLFQDEMEYYEGSSTSSTNQTAQELFQQLLPQGAECLHYSHDYSLGTQVLIVRSTLHKYVAVTYAGTDDWKTALTDGDILTGGFGPDSVDDSGTTNDSQKASSVFKDVPEGVRVHKGFNAAVFGGGGLDKVLECVSSARSGGNCDGDNTNTDANSSSEQYQIFTTGHSLGAADSVLLGATMHLLSPNDVIRSINFGCPKIGNTEWSFWIDSLQPDKEKERCDSEECGSFEVFRFVNKIDLIPRLPEDPLFSQFTHAGHTLQMSVGGEIRAYYDHLGDEKNGYAGVPFGWEAAAYALLPGAVVSHMSRHYVKYLSYYKPSKPDSNSSNVSSLYFVQEFERVENVSRISSYG